MTNSVQILLGSRIHQLRKRAGLTQAQLAERSLVSDEFLSRVERGVKAPSLSTIARVAGALGVSLAELFTVNASGGAETVRDRLEALIGLLAAEDDETLALVDATIRALVLQRRRQR